LMMNVLEKGLILKTVEFLSYLRSRDIQVLSMATCGVTPEGTLTPALRAELSERKAELISFLRQANVTTTTSIGAHPSHGTEPFPSAQQRLWFLDQLVPNNAFYNVPAAVSTGSLNLAALERTFNEIVLRHACVLLL